MVELAFIVIYEVRFFFKKKNLYRGDWGSLKEEINEVFVLKYLSFPLSGGKQDWFKKVYQSRITTDYPGIGD